MRNANEHADEQAPRDPRYAPHGDPDARSACQIASVLMHAPSTNRMGEENERVVTTQEVARPKNESDDVGPSGSREPSPANAFVLSNYVQYTHATHSDRDCGSPELALDRPGSAPSPSWSHPRHGRNLRSRGSESWLRPTRQPQQGSGGSCSSDLPALARRRSARMGEQGPLACAGDPDGVAPKRSEDGLASSGASVGGPGSRFRGCGSGAIRSLVRVGSRQGAPAEALRSLWEFARGEALVTPLTVHTATNTFLRCVPFSVSTHPRRSSTWARCGLIRCCGSTKPRVTSARQP